MSRSFKFVFVFSLVLLLAVATAAEEAGRAYYDLGVFAYDDGDYGEAEKSLKAALTFMPDNPSYNHYMGKTYLKMKRYDEALAHLKPAYDVNPEVPGLKYDLALGFFQVQDYAKAADLFEDVFQEDPSNVLALYHTGVSLYMQKEHSKALDYLINASEKSPSIKAMGYFYAGICHQKMGDMENAVKKLEYVKYNAKEASLRESAVQRLEAIEKQKKLKPYSVYMKLGIQYDDNVVLEPVDEDVVADEEDWMAVLYFSGRYNVVNRQDYILGAGYNHYQTWHEDLDEYDLTGSILDLYATYRFNPFTFGFTYSPNYYWLDSDSYIMKHHLKPEVSYKINENLVTKLSYSYYRNKYFEDEDRDGHTHEGFLNFYYRLGGQMGYLFGGLGYEDVTASHPDQYFGQLKTRLGGSLNMPLELVFNATLKFYRKDYDNVNSIFGVSREDNKYNILVSLSRKLVYDWLRIVGEYSYTKNDSNISDYEYKRHVANLSVAVSF
jgi:tetratricopeptide (TPR) repeat protein